MKNIATGFVDVNRHYEQFPNLFDANETKEKIHAAAKNNWWCMLKVAAWFCFVTKVGQQSCVFSTTTRSSVVATQRLYKSCYTVLILSLLIIAKLGLGANCKTTWCCESLFNSKFSRRPNTKYEKGKREDEKYRFMKSLSLFENCEWQVFWCERFNRMTPWTYIHCIL